MTECVYSVTGCVRVDSDRVCVEGVSRCDLCGSVCGHCSRVCMDNGSGPVCACGAVYVCMLWGLGE